MEQETREAATEAFNRLVCEHHDAVLAVAYARLRNLHDAEDVTQEVFVEAFRKGHTIRKPDKVSAWLFKATTYRCKDHIRKMSRRRRRELAYADSVSANPPPDAGSEKERRQAVLKAIGLLPGKYRVVVMLKHFARLSYADISKMTGLSITTVDGRLQTAKKKLKERLTEKWARELIEHADM